LFFCCAKQNLLALVKRPPEFAVIARRPYDMTSPLGTIIIYARDMKKTAAFYSEHFGFETTGETNEGLIELHATNGGAGS
jgi:hypothetical protein